MKELLNPWVDVPNYNCIGCSPHHPFGFHLQFYEDGDTIICHWKPTQNYQGWINTVHGGVQALLLDEICGWTVSRMMQTVGVTTRMETKYLKPALTTDPLFTLRARITGQKRNIVTVHATLTNSEGVLCTEATCDYFTFTKEKSMRDMHFRECRAEGE